MRNAADHEPIHRPTSSSSTFSSRAAPRPMSDVLEPPPQTRGLGRRCGLVAVRQSPTFIRIFAVSIHKGRTVNRSITTIVLMLFVVATSVSSQQKGASRLRAGAHKVDFTPKESDLQSQRIRSAIRFCPCDRRRRRSHVRRACWH